MLAPWKKSYDKPRQHIKKQRHYFANKGPYSQSYGFSSSHVWMWELDHKERWVPKNWYFWIVVLEKTLESLLDNKEIKLVNPKGNQSWIVIGSTDAEAETPILWSPDAKSWLSGKDHDAGKDWSQEKKEMTEEEMVWWYHWLNGHEFQQILGDGEGQGNLACCNPWGCKESDTTEWLNNNQQYLGCFHTLVILNKTAVNMRVQIYFRDNDFTSFGFWKKKSQTWLRDWIELNWKRSKKGKIEVKMNKTRI